MSRKESILCAVIAVFLIICFTVAYTNKAKLAKDGSGNSYITSDDITVSIPGSDSNDNVVNPTQPPDENEPEPEPVATDAIVTDADGNEVEVTVTTTAKSILEEANEPKETTTKKFSIIDNPE